MSILAVVATKRVSTFLLSRLHCFADTVSCHHANVWWWQSDRCCYKFPVTSTEYRPQRAMTPWNNTCEAMKIAGKKNMETFTSEEGHLNAEGIWALKNKTYWQSASVPTTAWCRENLCIFWRRIHLWFRLMGGLQAKSMTSQRNQAVRR